MYRLLFGTPLAKETMQEAVESRDLETVKDTIRKLKCKPTTSGDYVEQFNYFNTAIVNGDLEIVKLFIEKGLTDSQSKRSIAPLLAIQEKNIELLKLLLASGWVLKGDYYKSHMYSKKFISYNYNLEHYYHLNYQPLIVAITTNNSELIDYTFQQVSKNREYDYCFKDLLSLSVYLKVVPRNIVLKILKEYPDKVYADINCYNLVFLDAVKKSDTEIVKEFIKLGYDTKQNCREAALTAERYCMYTMYGVITDDSGEPDCLDRLYHFIWSFFN